MTVEQLRMRQHSSPKTPATGYNGTIYKGLNRDFSTVLMQSICAEICVGDSKQVILDHILDIPHFIKMKH